ncbi:MAG: ATP-binding cassette domain-containing protein [Bdellovibrionota bacterium]
MPPSSVTKPASETSAPIRLSGVSTLNLKSVDVSFTPQSLIGVTGPSGSGKSALIIHSLLGVITRGLLAARPAGVTIPERMVEPQVGESSGLIPAIDLLKFAAELGVGEKGKGRKEADDPASLAEVGSILELDRPIAELLRKRGAVRCGRTDCGMKLSDSESVRAELVALAEAEAFASSRILFSAVFRREEFAPPTSGKTKKNAPPWFAGLVERSVKTGYRRVLVGDRAFRLTSDEEIDWRALCKGMKELPDSIGIVVDSVSVESVRSEEGRGRFAEIEKQVYTLGASQAELVVVPGGVNPFQSGFVDPSWPRLRLAEGSYCNVCGRVAPKLESVLAAPASSAQTAPATTLPPIDVFVQEASRSDLRAMPFRSLQKVVASDGAENELSGRLDRLLQFGLGNLTLDRRLRDLSDGEKILLACAFLETVGVSELLIVLDEPSRILHPQNLETVYEWSRRMIALGNTVIGVEQSEQFLTRCDSVVALGPGAGSKGGQIVFTGTGAEWGRTHPTLAADCEVPPVLTELVIPSGKLVAVTGVAGSGKTMLLKRLESSRDAKRFRSAKYFATAGGVLKRKRESVMEMVATITDLFGLLAELFAALPLARREGVSNDDLMLRTPRLRCEACAGAGVVELGLSFDAKSATCDVCQGRRYDTSVEELLFNERSITTVLASTVAESLPIFANQKEIASKLQLLSRLGLSHLRLGARPQELSRADYQRTMLAAALFKGASRNLYLLDQPFAGLSSDEIASCVLPLREVAERNGSSFVYTTHSPAAVEAAGFVISL